MVGWVLGLRLIGLLMLLQHRLIKRGAFVIFIHCRRPIDPGDTLLGILSGQGCVGKRVWLCVHTEMQRA
jgi:hypothetical protein